MADGQGSALQDGETLKEDQEDVDEGEEEERLKRMLEKACGITSVHDNGVTTISPHILGSLNAKPGEEIAWQVVDAEKRTLQLWVVSRPWNVIEVQLVKAVEFKPEDHV